jgi:hypothetical protein
MNSDMGGRWWIAGDGRRCHPDTGSVASGRTRNPDQQRPRLWSTGCGTPPLWIMPASRAWPLFGTRMRTEIHEVPNQTAFMAVGLSTTSMGGIPLPMPLDPFGLPGCRLLIAPLDFAQPCSRIGTRTSLHELPIPSNPLLEGALVHLQAWAPAPGYNAAGLVVSNGERLLLGRSW